MQPPNRSDIPLPTEIWGRDMTRATFRRFVEADAREARTNNNFKLANERNKTKNNNTTTNTGAPRSQGLSLSAMEEFRVMRAFPTLLKIISKQGTQNQTVNTGRFSRKLRASHTQTQDGTTDANPTSSSPTGAMLSIERMETVSQRTVVQMGDVVDIRDQRLYLHSETAPDTITGVRKVLLHPNQRNSAHNGCSWCLAPPPSKAEPTHTKHRFQSSNATHTNIGYGTEFQIVWVHPARVARATVNETGDGPDEDTTTTNTAPPQKFVLCGTLTAQPPRMGSKPGSPTVQEYKSRVFVVEATDPRASGAASLWCFAGGAKGKPVLNNRQIQLCSLNLSAAGATALTEAPAVRESLLACDHGKVRLQANTNDIPAPQSAAQCWFIETIRSNSAAVSPPPPQPHATPAAAQSPAQTPKNHNRPPLVTPSPQSQRSPRSVRVLNNARRQQHARTKQRERTDSDLVNAMDNRPAFSPCSPAKAKEALSRKGMTVSVGIPYTALKDQQRREAQERRDNRLDGHFTASGQVGHRYIDRSGQFLHSPDARCVRMEQSFLKERATKGLELLSAKHTNNRKHWLKHNAEKMAAELGGGS